MGKGFERRSVLYGGIAALLFALLLAATFRRGGAAEKQQQTEIVVFGDSIFGLVRDETAVPARLQQLLGRPVYNAALGGTSMARQEEGRRMDYAKNSMSMAGLARAVGTEDFGVQHATRLRESSTDYFPEVLEGLETVDFQSVEIVLIQQGVNDYHAGIPLDNPEDPYDEYTFLGAFRSAAAYLRRVNPDLRIILVTPTYSWYMNTGLTCEESDQGGGPLEAYVAAEIQEAEKLGIEVIDVYHDFYPHETWEDWELYTWDGLHPNEAGREKLARKIAEFLSQPQESL